MCSDCNTELKVQVKATPVFPLSYFIIICFQGILAGVPSLVAKISTRAEGKSSLLLCMWLYYNRKCLYTDEFLVKISKPETYDNIALRTFARKFSCQ